MRARNIKPGFFINPELAECSFAARLMFAGLWMLADRHGRLLDRAKYIKGELFRYDDVDVDALLGELAVRGFIDRYEAGGDRIIQVSAFLAHQNPHPKERDSNLPQNPLKSPKPCNFTSSREKVSTSREKVDTSPAESVIMNHESLNHDSSPTGQKTGVDTPKTQSRPPFTIRQAIMTDDGVVGIRKRTI